MKAADGSDQVAWRPPGPQSMELDPPGWSRSLLFGLDEFNEIREDMLRTSWRVSKPQTKIINMQKY